MSITSTGQLQIHRQTGSSASVDTVTTVNPLGIVGDGQIHTISFVYDGSNMMGQLDGETVVVGQNPNQQSALANPITVGADPSSVSGVSANYMNGIIYSLNIYSNATAGSGALVGSFTFDPNDTFFKNTAPGATDLLSLV